MLGNKVSVYPVQKFSLSLAVFIFDIVKENRKVPYAHIVHGSKFFEHSLFILFGFLPTKVNIQSWGNREDKFDLLFFGLVNQGLQISHLICRIHLPPFCAVIGIVFWRIDIGIQLMFMAELQHGKPVSLRPGRTIKTFHHAPQWNCRSTERRHAAIDSHDQHSR